MKFIFCTFSVSILDEITNLIDSMGVKNYQVIEHALSTSGDTAPRLDTPVWPGHDSIITIQLIDDQKAKQIINKLKEYNKEISPGKDENVTVCSWEMENYFTD